MLEGTTKNSWAREGKRRLEQLEDVRDDRPVKRGTNATALGNALSTGMADGSRAAALQDCPPGPTRENAPTFNRTASPARRDLANISLEELQTPMQKPKPTAWHPPTGEKIPSTVKKIWVRIFFVATGKRILCTGKKIQFLNIPKYT